MESGRPKVYGPGLKETKVCKRCHLEKSVIDDFSFSSYPKTGQRTTGSYSTFCKKCASEVTRERQDVYFAQGLCRCGREKVEGKQRCTNCLLSAKRSRDLHMDERRLNDKERREKYKRQIFAAYGGKCACCGQNTFEFLEIDHIDGCGTKHRDSAGRRVSGMNLYLEIIRKGFPEGFRILCGNCHGAISYHGYCPHELEREHEIQRAVDTQQGE